MSGRMRTTVRLNPPLLTDAKKLAVEQDTKLTGDIEGALREVLARRREAPSAGRDHLTTFGGKGVRAGMDLDDSAGLLVQMEQRETSR
jgi:hypothetical protein